MQTSSLSAAVILVKLLHCGQKRGPSLWGIEILGKYFAFNCRRRNVFSLTIKLVSSADTISASFSKWYCGTTNWMVGPYSPKEHESVTVISTWRHFDIFLVTRWLEWLRVTFRGQLLHPWHQRDIALFKKITSHKNVKNVSRTRDTNSHQMAYHALGTLSD